MLAVGRITTAFSHVLIVCKDKDLFKEQIKLLILEKENLFEETWSFDLVVILAQSKNFATYQFFFMHLHISSDHFMESCESRNL